MKRLIISMLLALAAVTALGAQTEKPADAPGTKPDSKPESSFKYEPIRKGDQYIKVTLGPTFPLFIAGSGGMDTDTNMNLGASGCLSYARFINSHVSLGGELSFSFNPTLAQNLYFYLPIVFSGSYEFVFNRIHVPLTLAGGFAFQTYNSASYFGPVLRPEAGAWFQYNPEWSFGVQAVWNVIPQIYSDSSYNRTGNIVDATLGFRYHF